MRVFKIAVYPGDGIGTEVTGETLRVLTALERGLPATGAGSAWHLDFLHLPWGSDYYFTTGQVAPPDFLDILRPMDAILLGALGDPLRLPDHVTLAPLIQIRQRFDQYACLRPARLFRGVRSLLAGKGPAQVDLVVLRENSEGEYVDAGGRFKPGQPDEFALQTAIHTRRGIERILRFGFDLARSRRRVLHMITKSNAERYGYVLWDQVLSELAPEYPDVEAGRQHVDAAAMDFVRRPERFDVVVASNLFGDILSDLGGAIAGGLGLAASANINPERAYPSMFEPVHGSAPDIAGRGIANPIAAILSSAMMLDWLGLSDAAATLRSAVEITLAAGHGTPDLGGGLSTSQLTDRVIENLR